MSLLNKFMDSIRLSEEDDDYFLDDPYEEEEDRPRKGLFSKRTDEEDDGYEEEPPKPRFGGRSSSGNKVVPMRRTMEVSMIKPNSIEDSREVCDYLLEGKAVVLNMEGIHTEVAQRIIDFTSGATYSMNGNLQKISIYIFIATPESVELSGDFQDLLSGSSNSIDVSGLNIRL